MVKCVFILQTSCGELMMRHVGIVETRLFLDHFLALLDCFKVTFDKFMVDDE